MNTAASTAKTGNTGAPKVQQQQITIGLSLLLVVQLAIAGILFSGQKEYVASDPSANILPSDVEHLEKITLEEGKGKEKTARPPLVMKKIRSGWVLPDDHDFPVESKSIQLFLSWFKNWKKGVPVSTSADAIQRFKVGTDNYEELITVTDEHHKVSKVFLGAQPRFKSQYARLADSNEVYTVDLPDIMHMPNSSDDVIDRSFLQPNTALLSSLTIGDAVISRPENSSLWIMTSGGARHGLGGAATKVVLKPLKFVFYTLLGTKADPSYNQDHPEFEFKVSTLNGAKTQDVTYTLSKSKDKGCILKRSDKDCYVTVDEKVIKDIKQIPSDFIEAEKAQNAVMEKAKKDAEKVQKVRADKKD